MPKRTRRKSTARRRVARTAKRSSPRPQARPRRRSAPAAYADFGRCVAILYERGGRRYEHRFTRPARIRTTADRVLLTGVRVGDYIEG